MYPIRHIINHIIILLYMRSTLIQNLLTICAWQYAGAGCVSNYYSTVSALFAFFLCPVWLPVIVILVLKFVGGALIRLVLNTLYKKDFENA